MQFGHIGHRVATQYLLAALEGSLPAEHLLHYREAHAKLPGHPELGLTPGVKFSSGRLGHMWYVDYVSESTLFLMLYAKGPWSMVWLSPIVARPCFASGPTARSKKATTQKQQELRSRRSLM